MKKVMVLVSVLLTVLCFTGYAAAYSPKLDGKPDAFEPGRSTGYFIWQDREGLHLRATTDGSRHVFNGTIRTDGTFRDTFGKSKGGDDSFRVSGDRDKITFQFTNLGDTAGMDMYIQDGSYVTFNLSMDGDEVEPASIFIGADGWHPGDHKFTLRQETDRERYSHDRTVIIVGPTFWWHHGYYGYWGYWGPGPWHHHGHHW